MKALFAWIIAFTFVTAGQSMAFANGDVEGRWQNTRTNVLLEVEKTYNGIRVKRLDKSGWIRYESIRRDQFRDHEGNTYEILPDGRLEWQSSDGRRRLRFNRTAPQQNIYRSPGDKHIERNHYYGRSLDGKWINKSTGQTILVKKKRHYIKVKARRSDWVIFKPSRHNRFVDDQGNFYKLNNGRLSYSSYSGDFYMRFIKY